MGFEMAQAHLKLWGKEDDTLELWPSTTIERCRMPPETHTEHLWRGQWEAGAEGGSLGHPVLPSVWGRPLPCHSL